MEPAEVTDSNASSTRRERGLAAMDNSNPQHPSSAATVRFEELTKREVYNDHLPVHIEYSMMPHKCMMVEAVHVMLL